MAAAAQWPCERCTLLNEASSIVCAACGAVLPSPPPASAISTTAALSVPIPATTPHHTDGLAPDGPESHAAPGPKPHLPYHVPPHVHKNTYAKADVDRVTRLAEEGDAEAQWQLAARFAGGTGGVGEDPTAAVAWFRRAAEQEHPKAMYALGLHTANGSGVNKDAEAAAEWYRRAAEHGVMSAQNNYGLCLADGVGVEVNLVAAIQWYYRAATQGSQAGSYNLGRHYLEGKGIEHNAAAGVHWLTKAADAGYTIAQFRLGLCYAEGTGVAQDMAVACDWYRRSAEQGHAKAQLNLGNCYRDGVGVARDVVEAARLFTLAADQGNASASCNLGLLYKQGIGRPKEPAIAAKYFQQAADGECAPALYNLGWCYENGFGVKKDYAVAFDLYQRAVTKGFTSAHHSLGRMYFRGRGIPRRDIAQAVSVWELGAVAGCSASQHSLGQLYAQGLGVECDPAMAAALFRRAADAGDVNAMSHLADCYRRGFGVPVDPAAAATLIRKASSSPNSAGTPFSQRRLYEGRRTEGQLREGQAGRAALAVQHITNRSLFAKLDARHEEMVREHLRGNSVGAQEIFEQLRGDPDAPAPGTVLCEKRRLTELTEACRRKYEAQNWGFVERIAPVAPHSAPLQPCPETAAAAATTPPRTVSCASAARSVSGGGWSPSRTVSSVSSASLLSAMEGPSRVASGSSLAALDDSEHEYITTLLTRSAWGRQEFQRRLESVATRLNTAGRHPQSLPEVNPAMFDLGLDPTRNELRGQHLGDNCHLRVPGVKGAQRCREKVAAEYRVAPDCYPARPAARYLADTLRATFTFEDPLALALGYELVRQLPDTRVIRVKNKLTDTSLEPAVRTTLLVNVEMTGLEPSGLPLITEVQFTLQDYLDIKKSLHKTYKFERASEYTTVLDPVFRQVADRSDDDKKDCQGPTLGSLYPSEPLRIQLARIRLALQTDPTNEAMRGAARALEKVVQPTLWSKWFPSGS